VMMFMKLLGWIFVHDELHLATAYDALTQIWVHANATTYDA
jgi:hypothetical protein